MANFGGQFIAVCFTLMRLCVVWGLSLLLILAGIFAMFHTEETTLWQALPIVVMGLVIFPPFKRLVEAKCRVPFNIWMKTGCLILAFIALALAPTTPKYRQEQKAAAQQAAIQAAQAQKQRQAQKDEKAKEQKALAMAHRLIRQQIDQTMTLYQKKGFVREIDTDANAVYVDPLLWTMANYPQKQKLAQFLGLYCKTYCAIKDQGMVNIKNFQTGKTLATYFETTGLDVK